jgi:hypothetical protein
MGARVLAVRERQLPDEARAPAGPHFWVFQHHTEAGRFLEFTEGATAEAVAALLDGAAADDLWHEVQGG